MVSTYNPKTGEVEIGGLTTPGQLGPCIKFQSSLSYKWDSDLKKMDYG